jgi:hypothetical protein
MDSTMRLEEIITQCLKKEINCIAVTDHGATAGALKMKEIAPFTVIVGEEILTSHGEIIGLFLEDEVPSRLSPQETVAEIKSQGGLVCIPHPFDRIRSSALQKETLATLLPDIDIIEVFNSRAILRADSRRALLFAQAHGVPGSAGSDAHTPGEIGNAYVEMPEFNGPDEFLKSLSQGRVVGHTSNPLVHAASTWSRIKNKLARG